MKVMIVGAGKLGYKLAKTLINSNCEVTIVDEDAKVIERMNDHLDVLTVTATGLDISILKELNIEEYSLLVATTESDETNTIICSLAKKLGCKKTVARLRNPEYTQQIDFIKSEMGIDHIINSDYKTAEEISRYIRSNQNIHAGEFAGGLIHMIYFRVDDMKGIAGKKIIDIDQLFGVLIVAISRKEEILIPNGSTKLLEEDMVYIIGTAQSIEQLKHKYKMEKEKKAIRRVMIVGGGNVGYYLAKDLMDHDIRVILVENQRARAKSLTSILNTALIIHGDGTDIDLLEEEDLAHMDAFVGATGMDEQNILLALMAKKQGVSKVISKTSRASYVSIMDQLNIDLAVNPINIAVSDILRFIRGSMVMSVSLMLGDQAELIEVVIDEKLPIVGKKVYELDLPKGVIIGSIVSDDKAIIPNGNTVIHSNDRLIIFALVSEITAIDIFFTEKTGGSKNELWTRYKDTW